MSSFLKDPAAALDYMIDWTAQAGDARLTASQWQVEPKSSEGLAITAHARNGMRCGVTVEHGRPGTVYRLINQVNWSDGRRDVRAINVRVEQR